MPDLQSKIVAALTHANAEQHQRIARAIAGIDYPEKLSSSINQGGNPESQTRKGWPDYFSIENGAICGVEATRSKKWTKHVSKDIEKIKGATPAVRWLLFVCAYPDAQVPTTEEFDTIYQQFKAAGLDRESVKFVIGMEVVTLLAQPRYARVRHEILKINEDRKVVTPYRWTPEAVVLGYAPTNEEYLKGRVYEPTVMAKALEGLRNRGIAAVLGVGASGKSVLGKLIAAHSTYYDFECYNAFFTPEDTTTLANNVCADMKTFGHEKNLFVLDDIHLNHDALNTIVGEWQRFHSSLQPKLLLLGRKTGDLKLEAEVIGEILEHRALDGEVQGVFKRLLAKKYRDGKDVVPEHALEQWMTEFGGQNQNTRSVDLVALTAAIGLRLDKCLEGDWALEKKHASEAVWDSYCVLLANNYANELQNLRRLASLPEDFRVFQKCLPYPTNGFTACVKKGLVIKEQNRQGTIDYRFAHGALSGLIYAADPEPESNTDAYREVASKHSRTGLSLAFMLQRSGDESAAMTIVAELVSDDNWAQNYDGETPAQLAQLKFIKSCNAVSFAKAVPHINAQAARFAEKASGAPLNILASFLTFANENGLATLVNAIATELGTTVGKEALLKKALNEPLIFTRDFLKYAVNPEFVEIRGELIAALNSRANGKALLDLLVEQPLHFLVGFLEFVQKSVELEPLEALLVRELNTSSAEALCKKIGEPNLFEFVQFVYRNSQFSDLARSLEAALSQDSGITAVYDRALVTPLDKLYTLLSFLKNQKALSAVHDAVKSRLANNFAHFAGLLPTLPIASVECLQHIFAEPKKVLEAVNLQEWNHLRRKAPTGTPNFIKPLVVFLQNHNRVELAYAPASAMVTNFNSTAWQSHVVKLSDLTNMVRLAEYASSEEKIKFVKAIATPEWLKKHYENSKTYLGSIAGALCDVKVYFPEELHHLFLQDSVFKRVSDCFSSAVAPVAAEYANRVSAFGSLFMLGPTIELTEPAAWVSDQTLIEAAITHRNPATNEYFGSQPLQFWEGLFALADQLSLNFAIEPALGVRLLGQLDAAKTECEDSKRAVSIENDLKQRFEKLRDNCWVHRLNRS